MTQTTLTSGGQCFDTLTQLTQCLTLSFPVNLFMVKRFIAFDCVFPKFMSDTEQKEYTIECRL